MGVDSNRTEDFVGSRILAAHLFGCLEAINERAETAFAVGVREEVESLETLRTALACGS